MDEATKPRYLTKSRFKIGMECPTKLYYTGKPQYPNQSLTDSFLEALADGGYQVGELAKHYFPGGHDIKTLDYTEALAQTYTLLAQNKVVIYEAAIRYQNLFIRADILVKNGGHLELYEVKAKSFDPAQDRFMRKDKKGLLAKWSPYLHDVAFQHFVITNAFPDVSIDCYLLLVDKTAKAKTDGLNTKFKIIKSGNNRKEIEVADSLQKDDLDPRLLLAVPVKKELTYISESELFNNQSFESHINYLASIYETDKRVQGDLKSTCKKCEFKCSNDEQLQGQRNGYKECWSNVLGWTDNDFEEPLVTDIWNFRGIDNLLSQHKYKLTDLDENDIAVKKDNDPGLSQSQRQWLQVEKAQNNDSKAYLDVDNLRTAMEGWTYPLHFIDFETSATALPFTKGMSPYEGIAFQFSHHIVHADGRVEHAGEFLDTTIGHFPNFNFIRALKKQLSRDSGTIFRYSHHENTYLNLIYGQLRETSDLETSEIEELSEFIESISHSTEKSAHRWRGQRDMIDLWALVKRYYYDPFTNGSNSIKYVLPAILNSSDYLQNKYSKPIYGAKGGIPSHNFKDMRWVEIEDGKLIDPYNLLPKMFIDAPDNIDELLTENDSIASGGAALTAYAKMQFMEMSDFEREALGTALLKYCELDTLAMVMIFEAWHNWVN